MPAYHRNTNQSNAQQDLRDLSSKYGLSGELNLVDVCEAVKGRFASFCTAVGVHTLMTLMEEDVEALAGPKGKHDPNRVAYRHGSQATSIPMGNQRLAIERPRVRSLVENRELPIPSYEAFASDECLIDAALARMLHGLSTRDYRQAIEDYGDVADTFGTSKSTISERFIKASTAKVEKLLSRRFDDETFPVLLVDGIVLGDHTAIVAMGINQSGEKKMLSVRIGSTENAQVCYDMLTDLIERGFEFEHGILAIIDGAKALRRALKDVFGKHVIIQRCQVHKMRNVLAYLPKHKCAWFKRKLTQAWRAATPEEAKRRLNALVAVLQTDYPDAANSLREGLDETLTILRLDIPELLRQGLRSTNAIESAFSLVGKGCRNVKNWKNGRMVQRWVAAVLLEAEDRIHRIKGYRLMPRLAEEVHRLTVGGETDASEKTPKTA